MPFGLTTEAYLKCLAISLLSGCVGAQVVHMIYKPLYDLDDAVEKELAEMKKKRNMPIAVRRALKLVMENLPPPDHP